MANKEVQEAQGNKKLNAQQRAQLFTQATRQNIHEMPTRIAEGENTTLEFTLPKARFLSKILLTVEAVANVVHASSNTVQLATHSPYDILRRVAVNFNNGFMPLTLSGRELKLYNMVRLNPSVMAQQKDNVRGMCYVENGASASAGTNNKIVFTVEIPIALNDRDPIGLFLLQNEETQVTLSVDIDTIAKAYANTSGYTITMTSLKITPTLETFTVPPIREAQPDISVLKLVSAKSDTFLANSQHTMKLNVGTIYRKLMLYFEDENGVPLTDAEITSNLELIFNQADTPYSIKPLILAHKNHSQLGQPLPAGYFVLDFSNNGFPNYGGSRDYIDTERLTEFWLRFTASKKGKVTVISENLARLIVG